MTLFYEDPEKIAAALANIEARVMQGFKDHVDIDRAAKELRRQLNRPGWRSKEWLRKATRRALDAGFKRGARGGV